ncbi:unnamed protein product, partial [Rotaria sordida]
MRQKLDKATLIALLPPPFNRQVICTQPRRLAARLLASRVAEEFGCQLARHVTMIQASPGGNAASATYFTCDDARQTVIRLSHEIWDGQEINVSPSYARTSVYATTQNCKLKAQWFMTESEGRGHVHFNQEQAAQK